MSGKALLLFLACLLSACTHYTPKPRGYMRLEPPRAVYLPAGDMLLPYRFNHSRLAVVQPVAASGPAGGINLSYPSLNARIYGSYLSLSPLRLEEALEECRRLVEREARQASSLTIKAYSHPEAGVYGSLFLLEGDVASPIQFVLTDSVSRLFRGALYYDCRPNADSLAPLTTYLSRDILEFIQSFSWKDPCPCS